MAPKVLKRPAAGGVPVAKKGRKSAAELEMKAKTDSISAAVMLNEELPESARTMLCGGLHIALTIMKDDRHALHARMVEMVAEALAGVETQFGKKIESYQEQVNGADANKAALEQEEQAAEKESETLKAATIAAEEASAVDAKLLEEADADLKASKKAQAEGDAEIAATEAGKAKVDSLVSSLLPAGKEAALTNREGKKLIKDMHTVGKEFKLDASMLDSAEGVFTKEPAARGTFDKIVEKQIEDALAAKSAELAAEEEKLKPGKLEREEIVKGKEAAFTAATEKATASREAFLAAKAAEAEGAKVLAEKKKKVKNFVPEMKSIATALDTAKADLETFTTGAMKTFMELKELAPPPPEPDPVPDEPMPEPVQEEPPLRSAPGVINQTPGPDAPASDYVILEMLKFEKVPKTLEICGKAYEVKNEGTDEAPKFMARELDLKSASTVETAVVKFEDGSDEKLKIEIEKVC